ncbi:MAG TPA: saccharopine dehydrogenase NADP-binding domain-containing protein [Anaerolineae bacterium]|nr:saccharopine dehydrogenase NADP-binding domain-containing protein [Anaerolineae bacterium]
MNVFALGGYGKVGLPAIKLLASSDLVTRIAVAGRSMERAEQAAADVGEKAVAVQADGTDAQELASLLAGHDLIMNAAYNRTVLSAIRAAIHTGAHYCDVAFGDILDQALQLAPEARAAGITAIVASGAAPCISNLMGVHVARQLEEVEQLQLGFADIYDFQSGRELPPRRWLKDPKESLVALHGCRSFVAMVLEAAQKNGVRTAIDYQDGRWVEVDPIRCGLQVPLPQGGTITSYAYASVDPLFGGLPRDLATVSPAEVYFSPLPPQLHDLLREQALRVLEGEIDANSATDAFYDTVERDPQRWLTLREDFVPVAKWWVRAVGRKGGRAARCTCWLTAPMWNVGGWYLTSAALVAAALKILRGEMQRQGVMTAEVAFEPLSFFDEVASLMPDPPPDGKLIGESFEWLE